MHMTALWGVIARRLQLHLGSVTWLLTVILIVVLFATSARRSTTLFDLDAAALDADRLAHSVESDRMFHVYSEIRVAVDRAPAPLRLLAPGLDDALPTCATVRGQFGPTTMRGRQMTPAPGPLSLDPAQVLGLFGSLLALLVTCGTVGSEREQGTLQLVLTYPVRRSVVLLGEFIAAMLLVLVPVVLCVVALLTVAGATGRLVLDGDVLTGAGVFILTLALLISTAAGTGLLIASSARTSATGLTIGLFVWALFAVIYPAVAPSLSRLAAPVDAIVTSGSSDTLTKYWRKPRATTDARDVERSLQQRLLQADVYQRLTYLSPVSLYVAASEMTAGTSVSSYRAFLTSIERVAAQFSRWQAGKLAENPTRGTMYSMSDPPLDITGLPSNQVTAVNPPIADAASPILVLALWNLALFGAAHVRFARYDPRV